MKERFEISAERARLEAVINSEGSTGQISDVIQVGISFNRKNLCFSKRMYIAKLICKYCMGALKRLKMKYRMYQALSWQNLTWLFKYLPKYNWSAFRKMQFKNIHLQSDSPADRFWYLTNNKLVEAESFVIRWIEKVLSLVENLGPYD